MIVTALAVLALAAPVPSVGCRQRAESGHAPLRWPGHASIVVGPISFIGLRVNGPRASLVAATRRDDGYWLLKAPPLVRAGPPVTVTVAAPFRTHVRLGVHIVEADAIRLVPCRPSHPAFSYDGTIGRYTGWPGGFLTDAPRCARILVRSNGHVWTGRIPLGRPCR